MALNLSKSRAVVVVGGGFAGLTTAFSLSHCQPRPPIILIEPRSRFVFLPLLYELLSGELRTWEVAPTYQSLLSDRGIVLVEDSASKIDTNSQYVITDSGLTIEYAQAVLATGSQSNDFGVVGVQEYAHRFQALEDVWLLKKKIQLLNTSNEKNKSFVIVGAGATGVELACKLSDLLESDIQIHLIELGDRLLPKGRSFNQEQVELALVQRGVSVHLRTRVVEIKKDCVELEKLDDEAPDNFALAHSVLLWTAGTKPVLPDLLPEKLLGGNRLPIDEHLHVRGFQNVLALGDAACNVDNPCASTAQVAMQQGHAAAKILMALRLGENPQPFEFRDAGEMLSLGVGAASITGLGLTVAGPLAFQIRRIAYLTRMPALSLGLRSAGAWLLGT